MKIVVWFLAFLGCSLNGYEFKGQHFFASYKACDEDAIKDVQALKDAFALAVRASGATVLSSGYFVFTGNGLTATFILSESHASIHTYPEHRACFVDLFTCGNHCSWEKFDALLEQYLKPEVAHKRVEVRS